MRRLALAFGALVVAAAAAAQTGGSTSITGRVTANPLSVVVVVPSDVRAGREFRIRAVVTNSGPTALQDVEVQVVRDPAIVLYDPVIQRIDRLGPRRGGRVGWGACSRQPGSYVVLARAATGSFTAESPGVVVEITDRRRPTC